VKRGVPVRLALPLAAVATVIAPALRATPGTAWVPDLGWLLLLWAVPLPAPESWRRATLLVVMFGILRSSVSAISPFHAWAGYGGGLLVRGALDRRLSEYSFVLRFVVGFGASLPLAALDASVAAQLGGAAYGSQVALQQAAAAGLLWALLRRPARAAWLRAGARP
jgi:hypothetical protein